MEPFTAIPFQVTVFLLFLTAGDQFALFLTQKEPQMYVAVIVGYGTLATMATET
jgi:hypothetical protein